MLAAGLEGQPGFESLVSRLDFIWERSVTLAHSGVTAITVQMLAGGGASIQCLDDWTAHAVVNLHHLAPSTPRC
jgi:hypothetical protein